MRQAPYYVTAYSNMPSVLVELGFLTNPTEEDFLHSEQGQDYMSSALFRAFRDYAKQWFSLEAAVQWRAPEPECPNNADGLCAVETSANRRRTPQPPETVRIRKHHPGMACCPVGCVRRRPLLFRSGGEQPPGRTADLGPMGSGVPHAVQQQVGAVHKYRVGSTDSYAEACRMRDTLRRNGFPDAFVVAFEDGQRIPLEAALKKDGTDPTHACRKAGKSR